MKEFKGTPGRWIKHGDSIEASGNIEVAVVVNFQEEEMMNADASLIAAAPDLLEALQAMLNKAYKQNWNDQYPDEVSKAQEAISKALGEE
ncbi:hypothetical protein ACQRVR_005202 [Enterobacter cloacae]